MRQRDSIFGKIDYWLRVKQLGMTDEKFVKTLAWKRIDNASKLKAKKEIEKAF